MLEQPHHTRCLVDIGHLDRGGLLTFQKLKVSLLQSRSKVCSRRWRSKGLIAYPFLPSTSVTLARVQAINKYPTFVSIHCQSFKTVPGPAATFNTFLNLCSTCHSEFPFLLASWGFHYTAFFTMMESSFGWYGLLISIFFDLHPCFCFIYRQKSWFLICFLAMYFPIIPLLCLSVHRRAQAVYEGMPPRPVHGKRHHFMSCVSMFTSLLQVGFYFPVLLLFALVGSITDSCGRCLKVVSSKCVLYDLYFPQGKVPFNFRT